MRRLYQSLLRGGSGCRSSRLLHVLVIPGQVTLPTIALITRPLNAVILVGIDDELRVDAETTQRLVHLLTALNRDVEVALAAEEQGRRLNLIGVQKRIRDLHVRLPRLRIPRWSNLVVVLNDVLVGAVERGRERRTRTACRAFEASITRDQVVGKDTAITPAADTESIRIGDAHLDDVIDAREQILNFIVAPV